MRTRLVADVKVVRGQDDEAPNNSEGIDRLGIEKQANKHDQRKADEVKWHDNNGRCKPQRTRETVVRRNASNGNDNEGKGGRTRRKNKIAVMTGQHNCKRKLH